MPDLPQQARTIIVGGGIVGCSIAYHLAKLGERDVLLLEQGQLSGGTTWHAAGLVGQLRATHSLTRLAKYGAELYERLEEETGQATGFRRTGSLSLARTAARTEELRRGSAMAACFGVEMQEVMLAEAQAKIPLMAVEDLDSAFWIPGDGMTNPTDTTQALARGARQGGASIVEGVKVTGIEWAGRSPAAVVTDQGRIACERVVLAGGLWTRELARPLGVVVPLHAAEHMYVVTRPIDGVLRNQPVVRDPDGYIYVKEEVGGLVLGGFEPKAKPWGTRDVPENFVFQLLPEDWDQFEVFMKSGLERFPCLETAEIRQFLVGPESFTPDNAYCLGAAPGWVGLYVAAGFNSVGIASAGGAGQALAEWMVEGTPTMDLADVDVRRFHGWEWNRNYLADRVTETVGTLYAMHWPYRQMETGRGVRRSPLHEALKAEGACFGQVAGWERPNWFATSGQPPKYDYAWGRQNWFENQRREHMAVREACALFDMASYGKLLLQGRDAEHVLSRLCANDVAVELGRIVYTQMLNERGGIEADLTVARLDSDRFLIVTSCASTGRDRAWIEDHIPDGAHAVLTDVTSGLGALSVMGPNAIPLLEQVSGERLDDAACLFGHWIPLEIGYATVRAMRITYVGERGFELYMPSEMVPHAYEAVRAAGADHGLVPAGYHTLDSCRIEKAYRHWGHDIGPADTPLEAGLGFAIRSKADFIGREAIERQRQEGVSRTLRQFLLDDPEIHLFHDEPIWLDDHLVGRITSGNYGHALGAAVGLGYVPSDVADAERFAIQVGDRMVPACASCRPLYDPRSSRIRG
jgi:glycine cleavage system aminomethyltransferase T/glycine/D-amino acid oxidase-like deaminating enzyme